MEMEFPDYHPSVGVKAEIESLQKGIASLYPDINGLPALKEEASRFYQGIRQCRRSAGRMRTVTGSMQELCLPFLTCSQCDEKKTQSCLSTPGFPVQKQQLVVMGQNMKLSMYDYRGCKLKEKLESYLKKGNISAIVHLIRTIPAGYA